MNRRTKIVCTLGPATGTREKINELQVAGMNVARINCSHGDWDTRHQWIQWIREDSPKMSPTGILVDLQGPKFRVGSIPNGFFIVEPGQPIHLSHVDPDAQLYVHGKEIWEAMEAGDRLFLGDGDVELKLTEDHGDYMKAEAVTGGTIKSKQGVTLVGKSFETHALTDKDIIDLQEAAKAEADFVALSYVRRAGDLRELRRLLEKMNYNPMICAKIETSQALDELDEILKVADLIMVARGDLGLQMDIEDVPMAQKTIIRKCNEVGKPVITATQMLESMINIARPTRAEATDVANAILDGTDAIMLSGETATGSYPIEAVKVMSRISERAEANFPHAAHFESLNALNDNTSAVAEAAVQLSISLKTKAILTTTSSGLTPRMVSKFRPKAPILCTAWNKQTQCQMSVVWGVESIALETPDSMDDVIQLAIDGFLREHSLKVGDSIIITAGVPAGKVGNTNLIMVEVVE